MTTMKAIQFSKFGTPSVLKCVELPIPEIADDEILVEIKAAGVNPIDLKIRAGTSFASAAISKHFPAGLGFDFSGIVKAYGKNITDAMVGDEILGSINRHLQPGTYADYCVIKNNEWTLKPHHLNFVQAAALPVPGLTAHQALFKVGQLKAGERVLIIGANGAVGQLAIQLAKKCGAYVIASSRKAHWSMLQNLEPDKIFDATTDGFAVIKKPVDLIVDCVGGPIGLTSLKSLKKTGRIVTIPTITRDEIIQQAKQDGLNAFGILMEMDQKTLSELAFMYESRQINLNIAEIYPLRKAATAHEKLEQGSVSGKIILTSSDFAV